MSLTEINDELGRYAGGRAVGDVGSYKGLRCDEEAFSVTRSAFECELVAMAGDAAVPVRGNGA